MSRPDLESERRLDLSKSKNTVANCDSLIISGGASSSAASSTASSDAVVVVSAGDISGYGCQWQRWEH